MSAPAEITMFTIDCADPVALAEFYAEATGGQVNHRAEEYAGVLTAGGFQLGFARVEGYRQPSWPDDGKQFHIDMRATDMARTVEQLIGLGASLPDFQPGEGRWTVLKDPAGHPFCVVQAS